MNSRKNNKNGVAKSLATLSEGKNGVVQLINIPVFCTSRRK